MYGLPKDFTGTFIKGRQLELICFNANQVCLHFDDKVSITVESSYSYQKARTEPNPKIFDVPPSESDLMQLLEHSVIEVRGDEQGTLSLEFDHGHIFRCFDNSRQYESYHIKWGEAEIIV
jgi:hypothetical protein